MLRCLLHPKTRILSQFDTQSYMHMLLAGKNPNIDIITTCQTKLIVLFLLLFPWKILVDLPEQQQATGAL